MQGIRVFNMLLYKAHTLGYLLPDLPKPADGEKNDKFQGATVLEAKTGIHQDAVLTLDFASRKCLLLRIELDSHISCELMTFMFVCAVYPS